MSLWDKMAVFPPGYAEPPKRKTGRGPSRSGYLLLIATVLLLIGSPRVRFWFRSVLEYPFHYKEYKSFGIRIPGRYSMHGIDVSRYQSKVDWARVKKMNKAGIQISFAFIKATEGTALRDPQFKNNWENARKQGIIRGAYHYFLPNLSPRDQARHFINNVSLRSGDLPPVIDVEETRRMSKAQIQRYSLEFLKILEEHYGIRPILYTNRDFYKNYFKDNPDFEPYRFWIAHFHVANLNMPGDRDWHFWQHSDRGRVSGINEKVDFNVFNGTEGELRRMCVP